MSLVDLILGKKVSGIVKRVEIITMDKNKNYDCHTERALSGYNEDGTVIRYDYLVGRYRATLRTNKGEEITLDRYGRVPEVGSYQTCRLPRSEVK